MTTNDVNAPTSLGIIRDAPDRGDSTKEKLGSLASVAQIVARASRVVEAKTEDGDTVVKLGVTHRNLLPGYGDREIARVRAIMIAIAGNPYITTVLQIPDEGLEKATLVENKQEVSKSHWLDSFVDVPEPLKFVNVVYTVRVKGRTLEKYKGN